MNIRDDFILKNINEGYLVGGYVRDFLVEVNNNAKDRVFVEVAWQDMVLFLQHEKEIMRYICLQI